MMNLQKEKFLPGLPAGSQDYEDYHWTLSLNLEEFGGSESQLYLIGADSKEGWRHSISKLSSGNTIKLHIC